MQCWKNYYKTLAKRSGQSNLTKGRIATTHGRFNHICQVAPMWTISNTCFVGPTRVHIPNGFSIGSVVFVQFTAHPILYNGLPPSPSKLPVRVGGSGPRCNTWFLGPPKSTYQTTSWSVQQFLQGSQSWQAKWQTDHATLSVTIGCTYVHSTAMQPKNTVLYFLYCASQTSLCLHQTDLFLVCISQHLDAL